MMLTIGTKINQIRHKKVFFLVINTLHKRNYTDCDYLN